MAQINRMEVEIAGNKYILKSEKSREEVLQVVNFVNKRIKEATNAGNRYNKLMQVSLANLNLADDYFELDKKYQELKIKVALSEKELSKTRSALAQAEAGLKLLESGRRKADRR